MDQRGAYSGTSRRVAAAVGVSSGGDRRERANSVNDVARIVDVGRLHDGARNDRIRGNHGVREVEVAVGRLDAVERSHLIQIRTASSKAGIVERTRSGTGEIVGKPIVESTAIDIARRHAAAGPRDLNSCARS